MGKNSSPFVRGFLIKLHSWFSNAIQSSVGLNSSRHNSTQQQKNLKERPKVTRAGSIVHRCSRVGGRGHFICWEWVLRLQSELSVTQINEGRQILLMAGGPLPPSVRSTEPRSGGAVTEPRRLLQLSQSFWWQKAHRACQSSGRRAWGREGGERLVMKGRRRRSIRE